MLRRRRLWSGSWARTEVAQPIAVLVLGGGCRQGRPGRTAPVGTAGFTLLEILVALAVFAIVSVLATRILGSIVDLADATGERGAALADVQRALAVVERDVEQMVRRPVRDELGDLGPAVAIGGATLVEFTRQGWQNPLAKPRTTLQRVAYAHRGEQLLRLYWPVLDRAPGSAPVVQVLLDGVAEADFIAHDDVDQEHRYWPPGKESGVDLAAVELRLQTAAFGRLARLWLVPAGAESLPALAAETPEQAPTEDEFEDREESEER